MGGAGFILREKTDLNLMYWEKSIDSNSRLVHAIPGINRHENLNGPALL